MFGSERYTKRREVGEWREVTVSPQPDITLDKRRGKLQDWGSVDFEPRQRRQSGQVKRGCVHISENLQPLQACQRRQKCDVERFVPNPAHK